MCTRQNGIDGHYQQDRPIVGAVVLLVCSGFLNIIPCYSQAVFPPVLENVAIGVPTSASVCMNSSHCANATVDGNPLTYVSLHIIDRFLQESDIFFLILFDCASQSSASTFVDSTVIAQLL